MPTTKPSSTDGYSCVSFANQPSTFLTSQYFPFLRNNLGIWPCTVPGKVLEFAHGFSWLLKVFPPGEALKRFRVGDDQQTNNFCWLAKKISVVKLSMTLKSFPTEKHVFLEKYSSIFSETWDQTISKLSARMTFTVSKAWNICEFVSCFKKTRYVLVCLLRIKGLCIFNHLRSGHPKGHAAATWSGVIRILVHCLGGRSPEQMNDAFYWLKIWVTLFPLHQPQIQASWISSNI